MTTVALANAQDPTELFDLVRPDGSPLGRTKARAAVHRDGDWHRSLHVWVAGIGADGIPFLLFQRRGFRKDTWPGRLDATVGGHYRAGEDLPQTLREVEEEIGAPVTLPDLRRLGVRVSVHEEEAGVRDHELQEIFLRRDDRPLIAYQPNPAELAELLRVPLPPLLDLLAGERDEIGAETLHPGATQAVPVRLVTTDFIPTVDHYFYRVAVAATAALRGDHHVAV